MAKTYQVTGMTQAVNGLMKVLIQLGVAPQNTYLLTVQGRKTGKPHTNPVALVREGDNRWLVSPYGEVNWIKNARAAGKVTLTRRRKSEVVQIQELPPQESAPVLKKYIEKETITQPYFDVKPDAPLDAFEKEAPRHPVFRILPESR